MKSAIFREIATLENWKNPDRNYGILSRLNEGVKSLWYDDVEKFEIDFQSPNENTKKFTTKFFISF